VVLTPAVAAITRACEIAQPLPYLLICALIAQRGELRTAHLESANLVIYGSQMPPLVQWVPRFGLPSIVAIVVTYVILKWTQRKALTEPLHAEVQPHRCPLRDGRRGGASYSPPWFSLARRPWDGSSGCQLVWLES